MTSVAKIPSKSKRRRFIGTGASVVGGVLTGQRRQRTATNELNPMSSVIGPLPAGTSARDAAAAVHETAYPGEHLAV